MRFAGNGTNDAFESDPSVMFISSHQAGAYPGTGKVQQVGKGDGEGYSMNVPMPGGSGDASYHSLWEEVVEPAIDRFKPDMILVSAGAPHTCSLLGKTMRAHAY